MLKGNLTVRLFAAVYGRNIEKKILLHCTSDILFQSGACGTLEEPPISWQKKAQSQGLRFSSIKGGGWKRQHVNAQEGGLRVDILLLFWNFNNFFCAPQLNLLENILISCINMQIFRYGLVWLQVIKRFLAAAIKHILGGNCRPVAAKEQATCR